MANVVQRSFAGGELAPELYARTDLVKYATGLRTCRNMLVQRHGGVANRPGSVLVTEVKDSSRRGRLVKFVFNDDQTYVLELGDRYLRVAKQGGQLVTTGVAAWLTATDYKVADLRTNGGVTYYCTAAHTSGAASQPGVGASWPTYWYALTAGIYEIPTPYLEADLATLQVVQSADVVTIVHPSYAPRELRRTGHTSWTLTPIAFGPSAAAPSNLALAGGAAGNVLYWAVTAISGDTGEEGLPTLINATDKVPSAGTPTTLTWDPVDGALGYNVYRSDGGAYGLIGAAGGVPTPKSAAVWTTTSSTVNTATTGLWETAPDQARITAVAALADKAYDGNYVLAATLAVTPGGAFEAAEGRVRVFYSRDGEPRIDAGLLQDTTVRAGAGKTKSEQVSGTLRVPDNGYTTLVIDLLAEGYADEATGAFTVALDTTAHAVSWHVTATGFLDTGTAPDFAKAPPVPQTLFQSAGTYPAATTYYQQRRMFGGSATEPERVWASKSGIFTSFGISSPLQDDDSVSFALASRQVNAVRHMVDVGRLILFTAAGEWVVGQSEDDVLTPTNISARQRLYYGASERPPIVIGNSILFNQARGAIVRDLKTDAIQDYTSNDLTILAAHLVDGYTIVDWDFAQTPHSILWAVRSDGVLLGLTYLREQEVWGWHRHDTDGAVENVCVVPEGSEDAVYLLVRRTINGVTKRFIERLASRAITDLTDVRDLHFVDCGLVFDGRNTGATTVTLTGGVAWDEGELLTCTASAATFAASNIGDRVDVTAADGSVVRCAIEGYTSPTIVSVRPARTLPADLHGAATTAWALAVNTVTGLDHLEGKAVSVFADGVVAASPNNADFGDPLVVAGGSITLDQPYVVLRVGLPYISDVETLDIDTPQGPSRKDRGILVNSVAALVDRSRSFFAGGEVPTGADPLEGLDEVKVRDASDGYDPAALRTELLELIIAGRWNTTGRVLLRQVDPVPFTVLSIMPQGTL